VKFGAEREAGLDPWIYPLIVTRPESPLTTAFGWRIPWWMLDFGPPAFLLVAGAGAIVSRPSGVGPTVVLWVSLAVAVVALLYRRRFPLLVLGATLVLALALDQGRLIILPALIALFTVAEYSERYKVFGAALVSAAVLLLEPVIHGRTESLAALVSHLIAVGLAVAAGLYVRARADYVGGLRDRATRLERERALLARQAAGEERVRIARELHDVVAHSVSLMVVQAQALAATGDQNAEQKEALGRLANLGREALSEMHRMLGVLRLETEGAAERQPQPGVADLDQLVRRTGETGLDVKLVTEGEPRALPSAVDLSAYRIVQEALTNVIRHAGAEHVDVVLRYAPRELEVIVTDDGVGPSPVNGAAGGHGLVGMRERVVLFGGALETGSGDGARGYRVSASLPTE
jgi:signal transduction histidine kinase